MSWKLPIMVAPYSAPSKRNTRRRRRPHDERGNGCSVCDVLHAHVHEQQCTQMRSRSRGEIVSVRPLWIVPDSIIYNLRLVVLKIKSNSSELNAANGLTKRPNAIICRKPDAQDVAA